MKKFVLSASEFNTVKEAENKVAVWNKDDDLNMDTKLYKIVEVYDLKLKFVKRK